MPDDSRARTDKPDVPTDPLEIVTARVEDLIFEAAALRDVVAANREETARNEQNIKVASKRFWITTAMIGTLLFLMFSVVIDSRRLSRTNEELNRNMIVSLNRLDDCLVEDKNPNSCYAKQRQRTNDLLGEPQGPVNTVTILTAVCTRIYLDRPVADVDDGKKRILNCVEAALEKRIAEQSAK